MENPTETAFQPDQLYLREVRESLQNLQNGEIWHGSHTAFGIREGGVTFLADVAIKAEYHGKAEELRPQKNPYHHDPNYIGEPDSPYNIIHSTPTSLNNFFTSNTERVAKEIGPLTNVVLISHKDADSYSPNLLIEMINANPQLEVYCPPGVLRDIPPNKLRPHFHELHGAKYNEIDNLPSESRVEIPATNENITLTAIEVPHVGAPGSKFNNGYLIEHGSTRHLYIPDAGLSPEILITISKLHTPEHPLTGIDVSTAKYNPKTMHGYGTKEQSDRARKFYEEAVNHSANIPFFLYAFTDGKVPIFINHQGSLYGSERGTGQRLRQLFSRRIPITDTVPEGTLTSPDQYASSWSGQVKGLVMETIDSVRPQIDRLKHLYFSPSGLVQPFLFRGRFMREVVGIFNRLPVPAKALEKITMPGPNEITRLHEPSPVQN